MSLASLFGLATSNKEGEEYEYPLFELKPEAKGLLPRLQFTNASPSLHQAITNTIKQNQFDHPDYKAKDGVGPFIQGGFDLNEGYLLIEFWCERPKAEEYVKYLERKWSNMCAGSIMVQRMIEDGYGK